MSIRVSCKCGNRFDVADSLAGGITNCPKCEQATQVEGLVDPMWTFLRVLALVLWALATAVAYQLWGFPGAAITALTVGGLFLLIRIAM